MKDNTALLFNSKRRRKLAEQRKAETPDVLTARRAEPILTRNQAAIKAAAMREELFKKQDDEVRERGGVPDSEPEYWDWPESPRDQDAMMHSIMFALDVGGAHLSEVIDEKGSRRVIWRGRKTHVILSADMCLKRYGITGHPLIYNPFAESVGVGTIELGYR